MDGDIPIGLDWRFFEKVPEAELMEEENVHYIPSFPVKQPIKVTQPVRLVFQANQITENGLSLNDHLMKGEDTLISLVIMVLRFRAFKYVFNLDIHRMYHRFVLNHRDRDYCRFFAVVEKMAK